MRLGGGCGCCECVRCRSGALQFLARAGCELCPACVGVSLPLVDGARACCGCAGVRVCAYASVARLSACARRLPVVARLSACARVARALLACWCGAHLSASARVACLSAVSRISLVGVRAYWHEWVARQGFVTCVLARAFACACWWLSENHTHETA